MHPKIIVKPIKSIYFPLTLVGLLLLLTTGCTSINQWFSTPTPTATSTPEPTVTSTLTNTPVPTAMATPDPYAIDLDKLSHTPPSYEYLLAHLDEFVQGPDPLTVGMDEFFRWVEEELVPALGDRESRDVNLISAEWSYGGDEYIWADPNDSHFVSGQMEFFYFESNGTVYPVFLPEIWSNHFNDLSYPVGIIVVPGWGEEYNPDIYQSIENQDMYFLGLELLGGPNEYFPDEVNQMIELGLTPGNRLPSYTMIGFGTIWFGDHPSQR